MVRIIRRIIDCNEIKMMTVVYSKLKSESHVPYGLWDISDVWEDVPKSITAPAAEQASSESDTGCGI